MQGRLVREVRVQEEVYLTLKKEIEIIKIEEVKSLPLIRVLDEAVAPIIKSKPEGKLIMVVTMFLALVPAVVVAFGKEYFEKIYSNNRHASLIQKIISPLVKDYNLVKVFFIKIVRGHG